MPEIWWMKPGVDLLALGDRLQVGAGVEVTFRSGGETVEMEGDYVYRQVSSVRPGVTNDARDVVICSKQPRR